MRLAAQVDHVIGVDTHELTHTLGLVTNTGSEIDDVTIPTDAFGYRRMLTWVRDRTGDPGRRCWAIEGTGSFGAGLTTFLLEQGEWVVEIDRPKRPARRNGANSDTLDACRAAREALARNLLAQPRRRGTREAIRVLLCTREGAVRARSRAICHLKALIVSAPTQLRDQLNRDSGDALIERCAGLRIMASHSVEHRATVRVLRSTARRIQMLTAEADDLEAELEILVADTAPDLLAEP
ncbi:MAG: transposase, partial [Acidimicrobiia bacterium]|nr:transposase [Acidimicrobiia bacterium]